MALNSKHQRFVQEFLIDQHVTNAAKRAGYAEKTAYSQGSAIMKKPEIKAAIEEGIELLRKRAIRRAEKRGMSKERWLKLQEEIATANIDDVVTVETVYYKVNGKKGKEIAGQSVLVVDTAKRTKRISRAIKKIGKSQHGVTVEMHSKQAALDAIGKHHGWLKDHVHHSGGTVDKIQVVDEAALKAALKKIEDEY